MDTKQDKNRGILLGLAAGDALGHPIDGRSLEEIYDDYGPNGLMGYDSEDGCAQVTSYTQVAAFAANGLMLGLTRGQAQGRPQMLIRCITAALREWQRTQTSAVMGKNYCWLSGVAELRRKNCMDHRMLDALSRETLGTPEQPQYPSNHPSVLPVVIPIALLGRELKLEQEALDRLAMEAVALTHGDTETIAAGGALLRMLCMLLEEPACSAEKLVAAAEAQSGSLPQLQMALSLANSPFVPAKEAMQTLKCRTAAEVLAGAVYVCATCGGDFDTALVTAVNHSGRSSAVGAVAGAMMGAALGGDGLPEFYLEGLEAAEPLRELADDMSAGFSEMVGKSLFDVDWERKYLSAGI